MVGGDRRHRGGYGRTAKQDGWSSLNLYRALNLSSGDAPSQQQEKGGETNEMNAIIRVDGQTERGKPQRN